MLAGARSEVVEKLDYVGTARGRIGYASGHWLFYATGGFAFAGERFINTPDVGPDQKHINVRPGWAAGAGLEYAFAPHWSVRLEYLYSQFDRANIRFPSGAEHSFDARLPAGAHRPQPQGRLAGINELDTRRPI